MNTAKVGVIGTSRKVDERRYPIHPAHLTRIPTALSEQLIFEEGYSQPFDVSDDEMCAITGGVASKITA